MMSTTSTLSHYKLGNPVCPKMLSVAVGRSIRSRTLSDSLENRRIANEAEIEITPAMVMAGLEILAEHSPRDGDAAREETVTAIFEVMLSLEKAPSDSTRHPKAVRL
jgi:hypothetical protein